MAPRHHGLGQLVRPRGEQQEHRVGRRFLEDLQQDVGGRRVQPVGLPDHEHLPAGLGRRAERRVPDLLAHGLDVDVPALGLHDELVGVLVGEGQRAGPALAAAAVRAEQRRGERPRHLLLAAALGAGQQVRVVRPGQGLHQEPDGRLLPGDLAEHRDADDRGLSHRSGRRRWARRLPWRRRRAGAVPAVAVAERRGRRPVAVGHRPPGSGGGLQRVRWDLRAVRRRVHRGVRAHQPPQGVLHVAVHLVRRPVGVDHHEPLGVLLGDPEVRVGDLGHERRPLELDAVGAVAGPAQQPEVGFDVQEDHEVGEQPLRRPHVQGQDVLLAHARARRPGRRATSRRTGRRARPSRPRAPAGSPWRRAGSATPRTAAPRCGVRPGRCRGRAAARAAARPPRSRRARGSRAPASRVPRATRGPGGSGFPCPRPRRPRRRPAPPCAVPSSDVASASTLPAWSDGSAAAPAGDDGARRGDGRPDPQRQPRPREVEPELPDGRARGSRGCRTARETVPGTGTARAGTSPSASRTSGPGTRRRCSPGAARSRSPTWRPRTTPMSTVATAASEMFGIAATTARTIAAPSIVDREQQLAFDELADLRHERHPDRPCRCRARSPGSPTPERPAWTVCLAKIGPIAITDPTPMNATTMPPVIARRERVPPEERQPVADVLAGVRELERRPPLRLHRPVRQLADHERGEQERARVEPQRQRLRVGGRSTGSGCRA